MQQLKAWWNTPITIGEVVTELVIQALSWAITLGLVAAAVEYIRRAHVKRA